MTVCRRAGAVIAAMGLFGAGSVTMAGPASAHGAPGNPVSRAYLCGESSDGARTKACRAATGVSGKTALADWDNIRLPNVKGQDRQAVPDGQLCSGGIDRFKGLDLARADWPATRLAAGAGHTFRYRVTIPHRGSFRLYVTKDGYDPSRRLRWSDLEKRPFAASVNPPRKQGSYTFKGRLPKEKTGRHLIYTIWQTSDTPDTYYSCSDVVFRTKSSGSAGTRNDNLDENANRGTPDPVSAQSDSGNESMVPLVASVVAGAVLVGGLVIALLRRRFSRHHRH